MIDRDTLEFLRHFLRAYPRRSALMVGLLMLSGFADGFSVVTLLPLLEVAADGGAGENVVSRAFLTILGTVGLEPTLPVLLALIVVAISGKAILLWLAMREVGYTVAHVTTDLRLQIIRSLMKARWRYFTAQPRGYFAVAIGTEAQRTSAGFREACSLGADFVQGGMYFVLSLIISVPATLLAVAIGILFVFVLRRFVTMARSAARSQTRLVKSLSIRLIDLLSGIKPIKAMGMEDLVVPILEHEAEGLKHAQRRRVEATEGLKLFQEPLIALVIAGALWVGLTLGGASLSSILIMAFLFYRLLRMINNAQAKYQTVVDGESAFSSLRDAMRAADRERERSTGTLAPPPLTEEISVEAVSFSYGESPLFTDLTLRVPAGSFTAIVGPSGSGKTTIVDLILGLHQPDAGQICIDGTPLATVDLFRWRQQVGYVPQETLLFNDTLLQNITLGDPRFSRTDVEVALRGAGALEFVTQRNEGLDVQVGEAGANFSGGQRQRIAIARALLRRPKLLVLDEATTALDPDTEREICRTLRELKGKVTIVAISHQPTLREMADQVYDLEGGRATRGSRREVPARL